MSSFISELHRKIPILATLEHIVGCFLYLGNTEQTRVSLPPSFQCIWSYTYPGDKQIQPYIFRLWPQISNRVHTWHTEGLRFNPWQVQLQGSQVSFPYTVDQAPPGRIANTGQDRSVIGLTIRASNLKKLKAEVLKKANSALAPRVSAMQHAQTALHCTALLCHFASSILFCSIGFCHCL